MDSLNQLLARWVHDDALRNRCRMWLNLVLCAVLGVIGLLPLLTPSPGHPTAGIKIAPVIAWAGTVTMLWAFLRYRSERLHSMEMAVSGSALEAFEHLAEGAEGGETFCNPGPCCANVVRLPRGNRSPFKCVRLTPHVDVLEFRPRRNRGTVLSRAAQMVATIASQGVTFTGAPESGGRIAWTQIRSVGMLADGVVIETDDDWIVLFGVNPLLWAHLVADAGQSLVD